MDPQRNEAGISPERLQLVIPIFLSYAILSVILRKEFLSAFVVVILAIIILWQSSRSPIRYHSTGPPLFLGVSFVAIELPWRLLIVVKRRLHRTGEQETTITRTKELPDTRIGACKELKSLRLENFDKHSRMKERQHLETNQAISLDTCVILLEINALRKDIEKMKIHMFKLTVAQQLANPISMESIHSDDNFEKSLQTLASMTSSEVCNATVRSMFYYNLAKKHPEVILLRVGDIVASRLGLPNVKILTARRLSSHRIKFAVSSKDCALILANVNKLKKRHPHHVIMRDKHELRRIHAARVEKARREDQSVKWFGPKRRKNELYVGGILIADALHPDDDLEQQLCAGPSWRYP